jgi:hypothetical protein
MNSADISELRKLLFYILIFWNFYYRINSINIYGRAMSSDLYYRIMRGKKHNHDITILKINENVDINIWHRFSSYI